MTRKQAAGVTAAVIASAGALMLVGAPVSPQSAAVEPGSHPTKGCEDWGIALTDGECFAAGVIRFVALPNLTASAQFCKWQAANPGEWSRIKAYANDGQHPSPVITWMGGGIRDLVASYLATGAPRWALSEYRPPNRCKTPLAPPTVTGVTPGQTTVTVTVAPGG